MSDPKDQLELCPEHGCLLLPTADGVHVCPECAGEDTIPLTTRQVPIPVILEGIIAQHISEASAAFDVVKESRSAESDITTREAILGLVVLHMADCGKLEQHLEDVEDDSMCLRHLAVKMVVSWYCTYVLDSKRTKGALTVLRQEDAVAEHDLASLWFVREASRYIHALHASMSVHTKPEDRAALVRKYTGKILPDRPDEGEDFVGLVDASTVDHWRPEAIVKPPETVH